MLFVNKLKKKKKRKKETKVIWPHNKGLHLREKAGLCRAIRQLPGVE